MSDDLKQEPVNPRLLLGLLHTYLPEQRLTAFESGDIESPLTVIFIGGLGDGLNATPYIPHLSRALQQQEWSLTQIILSSSYAGFGTGSVGDDAKEIRALIDHLRRIGKNSFVLMGHSTGCQDIIRFFLNHQKATPRKLGIKGVVLQAPVSDREYIVDSLGKEKHAASLKVAHEIIAERDPADPVPSEYSCMFSDKCAISASRWLSLASPLTSSTPLLTTEDYFSSDLPLPLLRKHLGQLGDANVPACLLISERDESMTSSVSKPAMLQRFLQASEGTEKDSLLEKMEELVAETKEERREKVSERWSGVLKGAGHIVEEEGPMVELIERVVGFIMAVGGGV